MCFEKFHIKNKYFHGILVYSKITPLRAFTTLNIAINVNKSNGGIGGNINVIRITIYLIKHNIYYKVIVPSKMFI